MTVNGGSFWELSSVKFSWPLIESRERGHCDDAHFFHKVVCIWGMRFNGRCWRCLLLDGGSSCWVALLKSYYTPPLRLIIIMWLKIMVIMHPLNGHDFRMPEFIVIRSGKCLLRRVFYCLPTNIWLTSIFENAICFPSRFLVRFS